MVGPEPVIFPVLTAQVDQEVLDSRVRLKLLSEKCASGQAIIDRRCVTQIDRRHHGSFLRGRSSIRDRLRQFARCGASNGCPGGRSR